MRWSWDSRKPLAQSSDSPTRAVLRRSRKISVKPSGSSSTRRLRVSAWGVDRSWRTSRARLVNASSDTLSSTAARPSSSRKSMACGMKVASSSSMLSSLYSTAESSGSSLSRSPSRLASTS